MQSGHPCRPRDYLHASEASIVGKRVFTFMIPMYPNCRAPRLDLTSAFMLSIGASASRSIHGNSYKYCTSMVPRDPLDTASALAQMFLFIFVRNPSPTAPCWPLILLWPRHYVRGARAPIHASPKISLMLQLLRKLVT